MLLLEKDSETTSRLYFKHKSYVLIITLFLRFVQSHKNLCFYKVNSQCYLSLFGGEISNRPCAEIGAPSIWTVWRTAKQIMIYEITFNQDNFERILGELLFNQTDSRTLASTINQINPLFESWGCDYEGKMCGGFMVAEHRWRTAFACHHSLRSLGVDPTYDLVPTRKASRAC